MLLPFPLLLVAEAEEAEEEAVSRVPLLLLLLLVLLPLSFDVTALLNDWNQPRFSPPLGEPAEDGEAAERESVRHEQSKSER